MKKKQKLDRQIKNKRSQALGKENFTKQELDRLASFSSLRMEPSDSPKSQFEFDKDLEGYVNCYRLRENQNYYYSNDDLNAIGKSLIGDKFIDINELNNIDIVKQDQNQDQNMLQQSISNFRTTYLSDNNLLVGVYNTCGSHWVSYAIKQVDGNNYLYIKDSFGSDTEDLQDVFKDIFNNNVTIYVHEQKEQQGDGVSCGVFAMRNAEILEQELKNDIDEQSFKEISFCSRNEIPSLRESYGMKYKESSFMNCIHTSLFNSDIQTLEELQECINRIHKNDISTDIMHRIKSFLEGDDAIRIQLGDVSTTDIAKFCFDNEHRIVRRYFDAKWKRFMQLTAPQRLDLTNQSLIHEISTEFLSKYNNENDMDIDYMIQDKYQNLLNSKKQFLQLQNANLSPSQNSQDSTESESQNSNDNTLSQFENKKLDNEDKTLSSSQNLDTVYTNPHKRIKISENVNQVYSSCSTSFLSRIIDKLKSYYKMTVKYMNNRIYKKDTHAMENILNNAKKDNDFMYTVLNAYMKEQPLFCIDEDTSEKSIQDSLKNSNFGMLYGIILSEEKQLLYRLEKEPDNNLSFTVYDHNKPPLDVEVINDIYIKSKFRDYKVEYSSVSTSSVSESMANFLDTKDNKQDFDRVFMTEIFKEYICHNVIKMKNIELTDNRLNIADHVEDKTLQSVNDALKDVLKEKNIKWKQDEFAITKDDINQYYKRKQEMLLNKVIELDNNNNRSEQVSSILDTVPPNLDMHKKRHRKLVSKMNL